MIVSCSEGDAHVHGSPVPLWDGSGWGQGIPALLWDGTAPTGVGLGFGLVGCLVDAVLAVSTGPNHSPITRAPELRLWSSPASYYHSPDALARMLPFIRVAVGR